MKLFLTNLLIIPGLFFMPTASSAETWFITSLEWPPYASSKMPNQGQSIDKLRTILASQGIKLKVHFHSWQRAKYVARSDRYTGYFPAWLEEVEDGFVASVPVDWSDISLVQRKSSQPYGNINFQNLFSQYRIGIVTSYTYPKIINHAIKANKINIIFSSNELTLLKKLISKRVDLIVSDSNVVLYTARAHGLDDVIINQHIVKNKSLVVAIKKNKETNRKLKILNQDNLR